MNNNTKVDALSAKLVTHAGDLYKSYIESDTAICSECDYVFSRAEEVAKSQRRRIVAEFHAKE